MLRREQAFPDVPYGEMPDVERVVAWHDEILAEHWDSVVRKDDIVWVLGDISSGANQAQRDALAWIQQRPGIKHLIAGNHDGVHPLHRDSHRWLPVYLDGAFATVQMAAKRRVALREGHVSAFLSHFPYEADRGATRYPEWRLRDMGNYLLHGHTHAPEKFCGREIHVGVDAWGFRPVPLDEITAYIQTCEGHPFQAARGYIDVPLPLFDPPGEA